MRQIGVSKQGLVVQACYVD